MSEKCISLQDYVKHGSVSVLAVPYHCAGLGVLAGASSESRRLWARQGLGVTLLQRMSKKTFLWISLYYTPQSILCGTEVKPTCEPEVTLRPLSALIWDFFSSVSPPSTRCFDPSAPVENTQSAAPSSNSLRCILGRHMTNNRLKLFFALHSAHCYSQKEIKPVSASCHSLGYKAGREKEEVCSHIGETHRSRSADSGPDQFTVALDITHRQKQSHMQENTVNQSDTRKLRLLLVCRFKMIKTRIAFANLSWTEYTERGIRLDKCTQAVLHIFQVQKWVKSILCQSRNTLKSWVFSQMLVVL